MYSVHVQSICDSLDIPHFETHPVLKSQLYIEERKLQVDPNLPRQTQAYINDEIVIKEKLDSTFTHAKNVVNKNILQKKRSAYSIEVPKYTSKAHLSLNVHPRAEDLNIAYRDFILRANWTKVAILYSDNGAASILHLQHLLLIENIDCLAKQIDLYDITKVSRKSTLMLLLFLILPMPIHFLLGLSVIEVIY